MEKGQVVASWARTLIGTPFASGGRAPQAGVDCAGVVVLAHAAAGLPVADRPGESLEILGSKGLLSQLQQNFKAVDAAAAEPGDVALFWVRHRAEVEHLAVLTRGPAEAGRGARMVHSLTRGSVCEVDLDPWLSRLIAVYRHKGA